MRLLKVAEEALGLLSQNHQGTLSLVEGSGSEDIMVDELGLNRFDSTKMEILQELHQLEIPYSENETSDQRLHFLGKALYCECESKLRNHWAPESLILLRNFKEGFYGRLC